MALGSENRNSTIKTRPAPLCPLQTSHGLRWNRIRTSAVISPTPNSLNLTSENQITFTLHISRSHLAENTICFHYEGQSINPLNTKRRLLHLKTQFVPRGKLFISVIKNQSVYAVNGTSRCLFSDKYKTHIYSVGRAYNC